MDRGGEEMWSIAKKALEVTGSQEREIRKGKISVISFLKRKIENVYADNACGRLEAFC